MIGHEILHGFYKIRKWSRVGAFGLRSGTAGKAGGLCNLQTGVGILHLLYSLCLVRVSLQLGEGDQKGGGVQECRRGLSLWASHLPFPGLTFLTCGLV